MFKGSQLVFTLIVLSICNFSYGAVENECNIPAGLYSCHLFGDFITTLNIIDGNTNGSRDIKIDFAELPMAGEEVYTESFVVDNRLRKSSSKSGLLTRAECKNIGSEKNPIRILNMFIYNGNVESGALDFITYFLSHTENNEISYGWEKRIGGSIGESPNMVCKKIKPPIKP